MLNDNFKSLLASVICEKGSSYIVTEILNRFTTIHELLNATEEELISIPGIGPVKARSIVSTLQLSRVLISPSEVPTLIRSPQDVFELLKAEMMFLPKEHFVTLFLNTKNHIITQETISIGSLNAAIVHPRCVFRSAIKRNSASIVCVHNHPSGDPHPSQEDIELTNRLKEVGEIIGIELLDHCIIGHNRFTSLKETGYF
jgi:DNA repair protein RadC